MQKEIPLESKLATPVVNNDAHVSEYYYHLFMKMLWDWGVDNYRKRNEQFDLWQKTLISDSDPQS